LPPLKTALPVPQPGPGHPVRIEAPDACGRFTARILRNVKIGPSEGIVAERFAALGQKLILNAVDASNYVLIGMGHPTHAFDLDKIEGGILVRRARGGERLKTLDGIDRVLDADDVVVADEKKALGLAGVMGGWDTMITPETKNVLVEAAWFDPAVVRRMSRRHGIHSDASHRFERGADFHAPPVASALVSQLILADSAESGGHIEGELVDVVIPPVLARVAARRPIGFSVPRCAQLLGRTNEGPGITDEVATGVLRALGCALDPSGRGRYAVTLPSWRLDLEREIDLIEEVARVYGYNRFANTLPSFSGTVLELPHAPKQAVVRQLLLSAGYHEAISSTFCSATDAVTFAAQPGVAVAMDNPLSEEAGMLRPSLVPGMLTMLAHNLNRNVDDVRLFEMGTVFTGSPDRVDEAQWLAFGATGQLRDGLHSSRAIDFYDLKGLVEALTGRFALRAVYYDAFPSESGLLPRWLDPARAARCVVDGSTIGYLGELDPGESAKRKLRQPVLLGEIYLDRLFRLPLRQPSARELSRYQAVRRDFSLIFPEAVQWEAVGSALASLTIAELQEYRPAEIFRDTKGKAVPAGHYSMLVSTIFQSPDRTLRDEELHAWSNSIVKTLESLGGRLRA
jgi:phenylalanyl-tRNA synthetase beta chain